MQGENGLTHQIQLVYIGIALFEAATKVTTRLQWVNRTWDVAFSIVRVFLASLRQLLPCLIGINDLLIVIIRAYLLRNAHKLMSELPYWFGADVPLVANRFIYIYIYIFRYLCMCTYVRHKLDFPTEKYRVR